VTLPFAGSRHATALARRLATGSAPPTSAARREEKVRRAGAKSLQTGEAGRRQANALARLRGAAAQAHQRTALATAVKMRVSTVTTTKVSMSCVTRGRSTAPKVRVSEFSAGGVGARTEGRGFAHSGGSSRANAFARSSGGRTSTSSGESGSPGAS